MSELEKGLLMNGDLKKRKDGTYEEPLAKQWTAEYAESPGTGLWEAIVLKHSVREWRETGFATLEDAQQAAHTYYAQT